MQEELQAEGTAVSEPEANEAATADGEAIATEPSAEAASDDATADASDDDEETSELGDEPEDAGSPEMDVDED
jgi:hypothetical protein